jgi:NTP pyrophosphatase (non-canonical NTP hydrolase)
MEFEGMKLNEYQELAGRTINHNLSREEMLRHSLFEMCGELGEIQSIYQKVYQGHKIEAEEVKKEVGDLLWGIAEFCTVNGWWLEEIAQKNIDKLRKRYPNGFAEERSLNRE